MRSRAIAASHCGTQGWHDGTSGVECFLVATVRDCYHGHHGRYIVPDVNIPFCHCYFIDNKQTSGASTSYTLSSPHPSSVIRRCTSFPTMTTQPPATVTSRFGVCLRLETHDLVSSSSSLPVPVPRPTLSLLLYFSFYSLFSCLSFSLLFPPLCPISFSMTYGFECFNSFIRFKFN